MVLRLDTAEESQPLSLEERRLGNELKVKCLGLASPNKTIVRQRSKITFLAEGDANTKFFHLQACHRRRKNTLCSLRVGESELVENEQMAAALFSHYDAILGNHFQREAGISFQALGLPLLDLSQLDVLFTEKEVTDAIADMPPDKAPGPDGLTGLLYKRAWQIIRLDIMNALNAFWSMDFRSFNLVNEAFMILLRKKDEPEEIRDYRPSISSASLSPSCSPTGCRRCWTPWLDQTRARSSEDGAYMTTSSWCSSLHTARSPTAFIKIDIAEAFDSVSWAFLLELLEFLGLPNWRDWVSALLSTASTKILLNGRPGSRICHARGLRQGDPLSPVLFVLVMEALNGLIRYADEHGFFAPLPQAAAQCRASLYADDMVLFISPLPGDVAVLREILRIFGQASGLFTNMDKYMRRKSNSLLA